MISRNLTMISRVRSLSELVIIYPDQIWLCLKIVYPIVPNGFADHYPVFKWLFHWEYTLFSDKPIWL